LDATTALLMLAAGILHAGWHAIVKTGNSLATLAGMGLASAALALPFLAFVAAPPLSLWPVLCVSLALHAGYKTSLALAYEHGDLSRAYPLARGLVPLFAAPLSYFALHQLPAPGQLVGILVVSAGVLGLALERVGSIVNRRLLLGALGAGCMVAGYSVVDAYGTRADTGWASFTAWLIVLDSLTFLATARLIRGPLLWSEFRVDSGRTIIAGGLGVCSFAVFVWALSRQPVAVVVAFRECSVLFATLIGWLILRERVTGWRIAAVGSIAVGLILVAAWR
jgi:drug/metabolite transporter (DMT)-like permease